MKVPPRIIVIHRVFQEPQNFTLRHYPESARTGLGAHCVHVRAGGHSGDTGAKGPIKSGEKMAEGEGRRAQDPPLCAVYVVRAAWTS